MHRATRFFDHVNHNALDDARLRVVFEDGRNHLLMNGNRYDVIICDIKMPCKDGPSLYAEVQHVDPVLAERFVFCTGDSISQETQQFLSATQRRILHKPFEYNEVISCLDMAVRDCE